MNNTEKVIPLKGAKPIKKPLKPPRNLKKAGKNLWQSVVDTFVLEPHDITLLTALCETLDRKDLAELELKTAGALTFTNRYGEKRPDPLVNVIRDCNALMAKLRRELNLSEIPPETRPPKLKYGG